MSNLKPNNQKKKHSNEQGAVMFASIFATTAFLLIVAMIMDFGLFYYRQARLQNAADSAATAVAASIESTDDDMKQTALSYLKKNGMNYDEDKIQIKITKRGLLDEAAAADDYLTTGYLKLEVKIETGTIFGPLLHLDSLMLHSSSFVKVSADYTNRMPRALNYTLFAGSSNGTNANAAMQINGRTGTVTNILSSGLESFLNGVNENLIQPLIGAFGGTPNYTDLVHINLSEAITNGDIHSNSTINIGAQAVNVSRIKDDNLQETKKDANGNPKQAVNPDGSPKYQTDENGNYLYQVVKDENGNPVPKTDSKGNIIYTDQPKKDANGNPIYKTDENGNFITDADGNFVYEKEPEYQTEKIPVYVYENYTQSTSGDNSANDYGQVTYTAVKEINFTNTSWNEDSVHLYVQNQQKIEKTQTALAILNMIDYADVTNLATLQEKYQQKAEAFIESKSGVITQKQQDEIKAQKDNLIFDKDNKVITLAGQESIVYDINRTDSKAMLEQAYTDSNTNASSTETDGVVFEKSKLFDQISNNEDQLYKTNSTELLFQNEADKKDTLDYQLEVGSGNNKYTIKVTGDKVNRDYAKTHSEGPGSTYSRSATAVDAKYAMYKTFQQRLGEDGFITTPNLKPYFVRMTNKSVSNSIKSKDDYNTNADSSATVRSAVADLGNQLQGILDKTSYEDSTYSDITKITSKDTSPFFTQYMETKSGGLTKLEGDDHTTYKGYELYNSKDILKTPSEFVKEYKKSHKFADAANKKYFDDNISGKYANAAVQAKKKTIKDENISVSEKYDRVKKDGTYKSLSSQSLPNKTDVFLGDTVEFNKRVEFNNKVNDFSVSDLQTAEVVNNDNNVPDISVNFNIADYMPNLDNTNKKVYAKSNAKFAQDKTEISGLSYETSKQNDMTNKWFNCSVSPTDKVIGKYSCSITGPASSVVYGSLDVKNGKNMDVGQEGGNSTLIVKDNINVSDGELQIRKNSVVFVFGDVYCKALVMESGARLYVQGNFACKSATVDENSIMYIGGTTTCDDGMTLNKNATLNSYGDVICKDNVVLGEDANIKTHGNFTSLPKDGNKAVTINSNALIKVQGNFNCKKLSMLSNSKLYVAGNITCNSTDFSSGSDNQVIYCGGNAVIRNDFASNRIIKAKGTLQLNNVNITTANQDNLYAGGGIVCGDFNANDGTNSIALCYPLTVNGTLRLSENSTLKSSSDITIKAVDLKGNNTIQTRGKFTATENFVVSNASKIIVDGAANFKSLYLNDSSQLHANSGFNVDGVLQLTNESAVYTNNTVEITGDISLYDSAKIIVNGTLNAKRISNSTKDNIIQARDVEFTQTSDNSGQFNIACRIESWGDITFNCYVNIVSGSEVIAKGNIYANGIFKNGKNNNGKTGLDISGTVYSVQNVNTLYPLKLQSGKLYCAGNLNAAQTDSSGFNEAVQIKGTCELYVTGIVNSGIGRRFKLYSDNGEKGSIVSIFGLNGNSGSYINALSSNIDEFTNNQPESRIYLGDGSIEQTATKSNLNFSKQFVNAGSLYLYGSLNVSNNDIVADNGGLTLIGGNLTMSSGAISLSDSHRLIVLGYLSSNDAVNLNSSSKLYVAKYISINGLYGSTITLNDNSYMIIEGSTQNYCSSININGGSKFWSLAPVWTTYVVNVESSSADNLSEFFSNGKHTISQTDTAGKKTDVVINGLYIADNIGDKILNSLTIKEFGNITHNGSLTVLSSLKVESGGYLCIKKEVQLGSVGALSSHSAKISNGGNMYLMGGLNIVNSGGSAKDPEIAFTSDNADTFIAGDASKTLTLKGALHTRGTVNIGYSLDIKGTNKVDGMENRGVGLCVLSGTTNIGGNVSLNDGEALFVKSGSLGIQGDVNMASTVYNYGKMYILGNLNVDWSKTQYITDKEDGDMHQGYSLKNGQTIGTVDAYLYIGGTNELKFYGYVQNCGEIYSNAGMQVAGWCDMPSSAIAGDTAIINFKNAKAHFGGGVNLNSNAFYNDENAVFDCDGDYTYGTVTINLGNFAVSGNVEMNKDSLNTPKWRNGKSMSFMNGVDSINGTEFKKATVYIGGNLKLGSNEKDGNAGSYFTMGTTYIGGDLLDYCNRGNSYYATAIWAYNHSNTFIGGDCFGGAGIAAGNNSIFMVGGDYQSKRATKINIEMFTYNAVDATYYSFCDDKRSYHDDFGKDPNKYRSSYFYVGGNMLNNTLGESLWTKSLSTVPENNSRDLDIYSNSNVYVGGSLYTYSRVYMKQNVTLAIAGQKSLNDPDTINIIKSAIFDSSKKSDLDAIRMENLIKNHDYRFLVFQCLDENICSKIIVNGNMYVRDTAKIRDMTKNYINGNFACDDFVEIGKSLLDDNEDRSQASDVNGKFFTKGDSLKKYTFANAGYTYVGGKFESGKYTKVYASTTLRVKDDFISNKYLTLRHDAKIYVGKKLKTLTSVEGGSYSEFHVGGSLQASTSWIKLRDCTTVSVGGNVTALSYIELGKSGDYTRTVNGNTVTEKTAKGVTEGKEPEYSDSKGDNEKTDGSTDAGKDDNDAPLTNDGANIKNELQADSSDNANGGTFFIGQSLVSYGGQIFEYGYSQVAVGNYVFTPKYLTLRHNADLWVMPETFKNATYKYKPYVSDSDGSLWGDIVDKIKKFGYNLQEGFKPKQGSIYTLGSLTLNKNASIMGTYDCLVQGQCVLRQDALIYLGHDFTCMASSLNVNIDSIKGDTSLAGFDSRGTSSADGETSFPVLIYADNNININTTIDMRLTYLVANKGDVNLFNFYSKSDNAEYNAKQLPNAIASYQGNIKYFAGYGKLGALFYAPNGKLDFDGWYQEIWGCGIANTIEDNAYYFNLHRFQNWRTLDLHLAQSGNVFIVSENEYNNASDKVFNYDLDDSNTDMATGGSSVFFPRDVLDNIPGENY